MEFANASKDPQEIRSTPGRTLRAPVQNQRPWLGGQIRQCSSTQLGQVFGDVAPVEDRD
jgi:hypothetical protein